MSIKLSGSRTLSLFFALVLTAIFNLTVFGAGEVDTTFNASAYIDNNRGATVSVAQPDGKLLVGGSFSVVNGVARHGLARLNPDGSLDTSFDPPDFYQQDNPPSTFTLGNGILSVVLQSDGKIVVGGQFNILNSGYRHLVRLNTNGSIDNTFNNYAAIPLPLGSFAVRDIAVLPGDGLLFFGRQMRVVGKLDADGFPVPGYSYDDSGGTSHAFSALPDGRFYVVTSRTGSADNFIERHHVDGSIDASFGNPSANGHIVKIFVQPDGKILMAGFFTAIGGSAFGGLGRLNSDGTVDLTFNPGGSGANTIIRGFRVSASGEIFIGGEFTQFNGINKSKLAKLNSNGIPDAAFTYTPPLTDTSILDIDALPNGKIAIVGISLGTVSAPASIAFLNSDGSEDAGIVVRNGRHSLVRHIIPQTDGKVLIAGQFPSVNGIARNSVARINSDGTIDNGFVPFLNGLAGQSVNAVALQPDGKIIVGFSQGNVLKRLNPDGSQDTGFAPNHLSSLSNILDVALQPDGKVIVAGDLVFSGIKIVRLNADGTPDPTFKVPANNHINGIIHRVLLQPDGKVLICGNFTVIGGSNRVRIARLNSDGTLDNSFNPNNGANNALYALDLQSDGKILIGGDFTEFNNSSAQQRIGRLNPDGSLDTSFAVIANKTVNSIRIQPDGKILVGGSFSMIGASASNSIARLNSDGAIDSGFSASTTETVSSINLQSDGKILIGGSFTEVNDVSRISVARLLNAAAPLKTMFDYDGDGRSDVSVFRPSTNRWYVLKSSNLTVAENTFGLSGDVATPADYDGDGKTDIGIFRPSTGDWWYLSSINNVQIQTHWGASGDMPRPSDFDGDGRADFIIFRPAENNWYRFGSTGQVSIVNFGSAGDKPVIGDFDGDGKSDVAIYRPSTGDWWWKSSIDNVQRATRWGISTDIPAPADFDGDGKTDFAVYRPATGVWYIANSSNLSATIVNFGISGDKPVAADYDGDGKADIAVFRPSTGIWYLLRSTEGFAALQFGVSTDIPLPNAFVP